ncbi:MAG: 4-hydroxy-tetrahydrodipicolinate reductase [Egibacteraceae bacterium]
MIRVAVVGATGRMGAASCQAIEQDDELDLVARITSAVSLQAVLDAGCDVAVEFTTPSTVKANTAWLLERGVHVVVGATGLSDADLAELRARTGPAHCLVAPNFSIGAVLLMQFAQQAAAHFDAAEIVELHHPGKVDAPSGTALRTASLIGQVRRGSFSPPGPAGHPARGAEADGIPVHSVRLPGLVASQEVLFGGVGQTLTLRHDTFDRSAFMPGVLLAVKNVAALDGLVVGLEHLL